MHLNRMVLACQNLSSAQLTVSRKGNLSRDAGRSGDYLIETPRIIAVTPLTHFLSVGRPSSVLAAELDRRGFCHLPPTQPLSDWNGRHKRDGGQTEEPLSSSSRVH